MNKSNLENSEEIISKDIIDNYRCDNNTYSLWEEVIETDELDYERLEPIYNFWIEKCSDSPTHQTKYYEDEKGKIKANCCIEPRKVKYYKKKHNYYLTNYRPNQFKIKTLHLPINTNGIDYSQFLLVEPSNLNKDYKWLGNLLTNGQLFFGNEQIKNNFLKALNASMIKNYEQRYR